MNYSIGKSTGSFPLISCTKCMKLIDAIDPNCVPESDYERWDTGSYFTWTILPCGVDSTCSMPPALSWSRYPKVKMWRIFYESLKDQIYMWASFLVDPLGRATGSSSGTVQMIIYINSPFGCDCLRTSSFDEERSIVTAVARSRSRAERSSNLEAGWTYQFTDDADWCGSSV